MGIEFNQNEIDPTHYIGKRQMNKKKNKVRSTIVKQPFTKPNQENIQIDKKKPGSSFNVSLDLMKRCYNLTIKAKGLITNNSSVASAFSDVNSSLVLKFNDNTYRFNFSHLNCLIKIFTKSSNFFTVHKILLYIRRRLVWFNVVQ